MATEPNKGFTYADAGVDTAAAATGLAGLLSWVRQTAEFRGAVGAQVVPLGFFASVLRLTERLSIAISTDGVGSKAIVAQMLGSYEGIGVDCVAVNVNDVICTGAEPVALLDYISLQEPRADLLSAIGKGLHDGAQRAGVAIVGGELSQHPDSLTGPTPGYAFDISGTCVGVLDGREPITGSGINVGDVILGLPSDGVHANGLTLARQVLLGGGGDAVRRYLPECRRTAGEELLRPTHIYVPEVRSLLQAGVQVNGLAHISGDGLLNLSRLEADVSYRIDTLPSVPPVFDVIRREGEVDIAEMFRVFNMGVGFCVVVAPDAVDTAVAAVRSAGGDAQLIGHVIEGTERRVEVEPYHLVGLDGAFQQGGS